MNLPLNKSMLDKQARQVFPFTAIVGQDLMKLSLLLNAVYPAIGGVLVRGEKGTAKSTAVRGLSTLLPLITTFKDCRFNCNPKSKQLCPECQDRLQDHTLKPTTRIPGLIDLPLGATEDMVCGTIDFEKTMIYGKPQFLPGLLASAHRGILYIDEVNLLDDHLVDSIIDAAACEMNHVEREGISLCHESTFILIGTMNPEEGELRPQILDRFGLAVQIKGERELSQRVELLKRRESYDNDKYGFEALYHTRTLQLKEKIRVARELVESTFIPNRLLSFVGEIATSNNVAGHRADIVMQKAARAYAALHGRKEVSSEDIIEVAPLVLLHRTRDAISPTIPPPPPENEPEKNEDSPEESNSEDEGSPPDQPEEMPGNESEDNLEPNPSTDQTRAEQEDRKESEKEDSAPADSNENPAESDLEVHEVGRTYAVQNFAADKDNQLRTGSGRRSHTKSANKQGRYIRSTSRRKNNDLALDATLRAAAPFQKVRKKNRSNKLAIHIETSDIREKVRERRIGNFLLFIVDASGSMGAYRRMVETKAAIMSLLMDAYQKRDKVGMVIFQGKESEEVLPPTSSIELAGKLLTELAIGGRTPISAGLVKGAEVLERMLRKDVHIKPLVILLSDGKANSGLGEEPPHKEAISIAAKMGYKFQQTRFIVIDTENPGAVRLNLAKKLADAMKAEYFHPDDIRAEDLIKIAKENQ